ncbi:MAG TPA: Mu-like prophage major head subunit gpT family protein, partial [Phycisphaerae bacterium]|nr:Mu-like prophage major head subunit gpT family protein [Phycisphaerae bacterium]
LSFLSATLAAIATRTADAQRNPLVTGEPFRVTWVANPRLTWTDRFAIFRADGSTRPFIFQEELPVQIQVLAEGSELEVNENQHQYGVKAIHEAGYGFWQDACRVTFS